MVELELELSGINRERDFTYFIENTAGIWNTLVIEEASGQLSGFLSAVRHPASNMIGPGVANNEDQMIALIWAMLEFHQGNDAVVLVPSISQKIVQAMYRWGGRNCELHVSQCRGRWNPAAGIVIPTFMPETG